MERINKLEAQASCLLPKAHFDYFKGGADNELSVRENLKAYEGFSLWPRVMRGGFDDSLSMSLLGCSIESPIIAAPVAFHKLAHTQGELATAKGVAKSNSLMIISMAANCEMEKIVSAGREINPHTGFWLQLYIQPDREFTLEYIHRAESAGCKALVVSVDSPVFGRRQRDMENGFNELPEGLSCPNMMGRDGNARKIEFDSSLHWSDIEWLCQNTVLPVVVKGLLHPDDVSPAIESGASAIIVSNHGGRQLDGVPATISVLASMEKANAGRVPLILDGGIRRGTDVLKALALGASAVALGRPLIWGLAVNGEQGVADVLLGLHQELESALLLCGCRNRQDINARLIYPNSSREET